MEAVNSIILIANVELYTFIPRCRSLLPCAIKLVMKAFVGIVACSNMVSLGTNGHIPRHLVLGREEGQLFTLAYTAITKSVKLVYGPYNLITRAKWAANGKQHSYFCLLFQASVALNLTYTSHRKRSSMINT